VVENSLEVAVVDIGVAAKSRAGEVESGDCHLAQPFPGGMLLAVADGLGHGREAAQVAASATRLLRQHAAEQPITLLRRCHQRLRGTRGAVMSLASFNYITMTMSWLGVGNVEGMVLQDNRSREFLLRRNGVLGISIDTPPYVRILPVKSGDTIVFATDGICDGFTGLVNRKDPPQKIADLIMQNYCRAYDDALVLVARLSKPS
jgi:negative regulator of sigma-B (phosphoserine phosphatase)